MVSPQHPGSTGALSLPDLRASRANSAAMPPQVPTSSAPCSHALNGPLRGLIIGAGCTPVHHTGYLGLLCSARGLVALQLSFSFSFSFSLPLLPHPPPLSPSLSLRPPKPFESSRGAPPPAACCAGQAAASSKHLEARSARKVPGPAGEASELTSLSLASLQEPSSTSLSGQHPAQAARGPLGAQTTRGYLATHAERRLLSRGACSMPRGSAASLGRVGHGQQPQQQQPRRCTGCAAGAADMLSLGHAKLGLARVQPHAQPAQAPLRASC